MLSEEAAQAPYSTRRNWSRLWIVDPLDGTKEFVQRNGEFTVNIALVDNHRPVLGIVHAPVLERTYYACDGVGAFRSDREATGQPIRVARRGPGPRARGRQPLPPRYLRSTPSSSASARTNSWKSAAR